MKMTAWTAGAAAAFTFLVAGPAAAQDGGWHASITPYAWIPSVVGDVDTRFSSSGGGGSGNTVTGNFEDFFELSGAFLLKGEVRYDRLGVIGDFSYVKLSGDKELVVNGVPRANGELELENTQATLAGFFRVHQTEALTVDLLAGARLNSVSVEVDLARAGLPGVTGSRSADLIDPVIGARATAQLGGPWSVTGYGDYGGGSDADATWQLVGAVNYRIRNSIFLHGGYRYYAVDFSRDQFSADIRARGPLVGATFVF